MCELMTKRLMRECSLRGQRNNKVAFRLTALFQVVVHAVVFHFPKFADWRIELWFLEVLRNSLKGPIDVNVEGDGEENEEDVKKGAAE